MRTEDLPAGWRGVVLKEIPGSPWRNGGGLTREIASGCMGADRADATHWDWRVSVADIVQEGAFSVFPGIDRQAALAAGSALQLRADKQVLHFAARGDVQSFPGELALASQLPDGPVQLFNVMTRRGHAQAQLRALHGDEYLELQRSSTVVLLCLHGSYQFHDMPAPIVAGEGLVIATDSACRIAVRRLTPEGCLLAAAIRPA